MKILIRGEIVDKFETDEGVKQGCPLSAEIFNIVISDMEEELEKVQGGGINLGKERIRTISYADDMAIIAEDEESLKRMLKKLERYLKRKGLDLNVDKMKIMCFRKAGGRRKK